MLLSLSKIPKIKKRIKKRILYFVWKLWKIVKSAEVQKNVAKTNRQTNKQTKTSTLAFYYLACRNIVQSEWINLDIVSAMYQYCIK